MCNGKDPWSMLQRNGELVVDCLGTAMNRAGDATVLQHEFIALKAMENDSFLQLAISTLQLRPASDVPHNEAKLLLEYTLRVKPDNRAEGFAELVNLFEKQIATSALTYVLWHNYDVC